MANLDNMADIIADTRLLNRSLITNAYADQL